MKKKDKKGVFYSIIEMFILMLLLMSAFRFFEYYMNEKLTEFQWNAIGFLYPVLAACIIVFFILQQYIRHNRKLILEIRYLQRKEMELKEQINELRKFKELVVWWGQRVDDLQKEVNIIKKELNRHSDESDYDLEEQKKRDSGESLD